MPDPIPFTASMIEGWRWSTAGALQGMTQTSALRDYRAGGGHISNAGWSTIYHLGQEAVSTGEWVAGQAVDVPLPTQAYTVTPYDYGENFLATAKLSYIDPETGEHVTRGATILSDQPMTVAETEEAFAEIADRYGTQAGGYAVAVTAVLYWQRNVHLPERLGWEW